MAAEKLAASADPTTRSSASSRCEYLVAAYGADKLNDPAKAEPVVQQMIQLEPGEPTNYFALAQDLRGRRRLRRSRADAGAGQGRPSRTTRRST